MGDYLKAQYNKISVYDEMKQIAEEQGYELTPTAEKVAKFRERTHQPISICPCDPKNPYRGCVGSACRVEIENDGICKCQAYRKRSCK